MSPKSEDINYGLGILAKIIARKFISDCQNNRKTKFDVGDMPDMTEKLALNKEGKATAI
jgi:hypothetical protein